MICGKATEVCRDIEKTEKERDRDMERYGRKQQSFGETEGKTETEIWKDRESQIKRDR
jgi:hypothetical protein